MIDHENIYRQIFRLQFHPELFLKSGEKDARNVELAGIAIRVACASGRLGRLVSLFTRMAAVSNAG